MILDVEKKGLSKVLISGGRSGGPGRLAGFPCRADFYSPFLNENQLADHFPSPFLEVSGAEK